MKKLFATFSIAMLLTTQMGQMSYATSVPPAPVDSTSEVSISYDTSAFVYVDNSPEDGDKMYLSTAQPLNIRVVFSKLTQNTTVVLKVPKRLAIDNPIMSTQGGNSILSENVKITETGSSPDDHKLYTFVIEDGIQGEFNVATRVKFIQSHGYEGQQEIIQTIIKDGENDVVSEDLLLKSYVDTKIAIIGTSISSTVFSNGVEIVYEPWFQTQRKRKTDPDYGSDGDPGNVNSTASAIKDMEIRIKLPVGARYTGTDYIYDPQKHEIYKQFNGYFWRWHYEPKISLVYEGVSDGTPLVRPKDTVTIKGLEGGVVKKQWTQDLSFPDHAVISAPQVRLLENSTPITTLVKGAKKYHIMNVRLHNRGTKDAQNVQIKYNFPAGIQIDTLDFGNSTYTQSEHNYTLSYITNTNQNRTVSLSENAQKTYGRSELMLTDGEYIVSATLEIDRFPINARLGSDLAGSSAFSKAGINFFGNITSDVDEGVPVHITVSENGMKVSERDRALGYTTQQGMDVQVSEYSSKKIINPGESVAISASFGVQAYHYHLGNYLKDPTIFMFVPEGFVPIESSLEIANVQSHGPLTLVKTVTIGNNSYTVYKITTQKEWYRYGWFYPGRDNSSISAKITLQSQITAQEGDYRINKVFAMGSENSDYKVYGGYRVSNLKTSVYGIGADNTVYKNITPVHINKSSFALQDRIQSEVDKAPVQTFDTASDNYSRYYSADKGNVGVGLYNPKDVAITNFRYDVRLPSMSDQRSSEWTASLVAPVDVSAVPGAVASYSSDGTSYSNTFSADARYVRVTIPQIPAHTKYAFSLPMQAPAIDPEDKYYDKTARLTSSYTFDNTTYDIGVKKLKLMTHREPYKVEHYQEQLDGSYDLLVTDTLSGVVNENVTADYENYVGYTSNTAHTDTLAQGTVNASGSLVLKLYYALNEYSVSLDGSSVPAQTIKYRGTVTQPTTPTKTGYTFEGWYVDSDFATPFDFSSPITQDTTLYAKWTQIVFAGSGSYTVTGSFIRNNCDENFGGGAVIFSHRATATATGSTLEEANTLAEQKAKTQAEAYLASEEGQKKAQDYANANGTCTQNVFTGTYTATGSQMFTPVCEDGFEPTPEAYTSTVTKTATGSTQTEANALAQELAEKAVSDDIINNGQNHINIYGTCTEKVVIVPPIPVLPHTGAEW